MTGKQYIRCGFHGPEVWDTITCESRDALPHEVESLPRCNLFRGGGREQLPPRTIKPNEDTMKPKTIRIPDRFYVDHMERALDTPADLGKCKTHAIVSVDDPHLGELLDDAEHYAHPSGPDACGRGLIMSAKATVRAIRNVIGWDDACPAIKELRKEATR
jgi:hypothetical protein